MLEYYIWLYSKIHHGSYMDAPTWIPAGSMLNMNDDECWKADIQ